MNLAESVSSGWRQWRAMGPCKERIDFWRETICQAVLDVNMTAQQQRQETSFQGHIKSLDRLGARLISFEASGHGVQRTPKHVDRNENQHLMVSLQLEGVSRISQKNGAIELTPGDIGIVDANKPFELHFPADVKRRIVLLPKADLAQQRRELLQLEKPLRIPKNFAFMPVLAGFIQAATTNGEQLSAQHLRLLLDGLADYLNEGIEGAPNHRHLPAGKAEYEQAIEFILAHIRDAELGIPQIAAHLGVSIRTLHRLFQRFSDTSCERFIYEYRLELAYKELKTQTYCSVAEAAFAVGFGDQAHFTRRFRERFGVLPSALL